MSTILDELGRRLHDPTHIRWTADELTRIVREALHTWNAFTGWAIGRGTFATTSGVAFYDLATVLPTLCGPAVADNELLAGINDKLIEGTVTPQFAQSFLTTSYTRRHQQVLIESGVVLVRRLETVVIPSSDGRYPLDPCILHLRRVAWSENGNSSTRPLQRDDEWSLDRHFDQWPLAPQRRPRFWGLSTRPPQYIQLAPIPTHAGTLDFICIIDCTPIPPDWTWVAPYGVLADLLGQSGPGSDPERSAYCEFRFRHGLEAMKTGPLIHGARLDNRILPITAWPENDQYRPDWQTRTGRPRELLTIGQTMVALSPVPDGTYTVQLDVVQAAPVPSLAADPVSLPPAARDAILDYCEHLALIKEGPDEINQSRDLLTRFFTAAGARLSIDRAHMPQRGSLWSLESHDQRTAAPHHLTLDPAQVSGVGSQPTFPNPEVARG